MKRAFDNYIILTVSLGYDYLKYELIQISNVILQKKVVVITGY